MLAGWFTTEVGRQPWVVYGLLRTADAVSPVPGGSVLPRSSVRARLRRLVRRRHLSTSSSWCSAGRTRPPPVPRARPRPTCSPRPRRRQATHDRHGEANDRDPADRSLPLFWAAIIALAVLLYVLLDGFDLGVGILFRWRPRDEDRDAMMNSVAPIWDGNETWLVLGGAGLFAAFPLAYAVFLPALYLPLLLMLIGLIFRGVAFEFRFKAERYAGSLGPAFAGGSVLAALQGGPRRLRPGLRRHRRPFTGGAFDWLSPFSLMTGLALLFGYVLLGAGWLVLKVARPCAIGLRRRPSARSASRRSSAWSAFGRRSSHPRSPRAGSRPGIRPSLPGPSGYHRARRRAVAGARAASALHRPSC